MKRLVPAERLVVPALVLLTFAVYHPVSDHAFIDFDDPDYIHRNAVVLGGLTWHGAKWAFTAFHAGNWHPLAWLSHMLDVEIFGVAPGAHHAVGAALHALNAALLLLALRRMTGCTWRSAFVASVFAVHPLHVESVAWAAERKDLLSGLFFMLVLLAYCRYVRRRGPARYLSVTVLFALGLMAKPMLVTVPPLLLLLDLWPLGRTGIAPPADGRPWSRESPRNLVLEKIPLLALSAASSFVTYYAQAQGGMVRAPGFLSLSERVANALVSYAAYVGKTVWPSGLGVLYPYPWSGIPLWQSVGAGVLLAVVTVAAIRLARRAPYLIVGWLWFLGTLVPVIGLVPVGNQAMADRYTYLPLVGLAVAAAWGGNDLLAARRNLGRVLGGVAGSVVLALAVSAFFQVGHWKDAETLYKHTLSVTGPNCVIQNSLGAVMFRQGRFEEAAFHFREAIRIRPDYADAHINLGLALSKQGRFDEAMAHMREGYRIRLLLRQAGVKIP